MNLTILTIVLDGMPYITRHLAEFKKLKIDWHWIIVEGQSGNTADTAWCKPMPPRLSEDGTTGYLDSIRSCPNVTIIREPYWDNKTVMCNAGLVHARASGVLLQVDADEIWKADQIERICLLFRDNPLVNRMNFYCRYFIGPDIVTTYEGNEYSGNWLRAWRFRRDMRFNKHEPPILNLNLGRAMDRDATRNNGLVFDHYSWANVNQVAYKEKFYGYKGAVDGWKRLQDNKVWPTKIKPFMNWVDDSAIAIKV